MRKNFQRFWYIANTNLQGVNFTANNFSPSQVSYASFFRKMIQIEMIIINMIGELGCIIVRCQECFWRTSDVTVCPVFPPNWRVGAGMTASGDSTEPCDVCCNTY